MERSSNAAPTSASAINAQASAKLNAEKDALARRLRAVDATSLRHGVAAATSGGVVAMQAVQGKVAVTAVEKAAVRKAAQQRVREGQMSLSGRLFRLLEYLKDATPGARTADQIRHDVRLDLRTDRELLDHILRNPKITFDAASSSYAYRPTYNVRNADSLLRLVERHWRNGDGGLDDLAKSNHILVHRKKDGKTPSVLFFNDYPDVAMGNMDAEYARLWSQFEPPDEEDVQKQMAGAGLKLLEVESAKGGAKDDDNDGPKGTTSDYMVDVYTRRRRRKGRTIKITNTHLKDLDLSVDYVKKMKPSGC